MFGNGAGDFPAQQPQDTKSLWGDMFGLTGLMKVISDPALMAHAHAMMASVMEGANANRRIEAKLDRLLGALGHEISDINSRFPAQFQPTGAPALLEGNASDGPRRHPASSGAVDDGSSGAASSPATPSLGSRLGGPHDGPTDDGA
jgi:hypothetical protein